MWTRIALFRLLRRSLAAQILLAFTVVILVGIGGVAILANKRTTDAFEHYLRGGDPVADARLARVTALVYGQSASWATVSQVLSAIPGPPDQRVVVADASGTVVVDTAGAWDGRAAASLSLTQGHAITVNGTVVGTLYHLSPFFAGPREAGPNRGPVRGAGGFGPGPGPAVFGFSASDQAFLAQVNQSIFLAAVGATLAALILGILLARQIIRPLRQLTRVAQRIAHGHFDERIRVSGEDEVAQLADAFNQMAASLERTEQARRQLVADVAHELRTPLTVIGGTVQAMQDGVLPVDEQNLASIQDEVAALTRLVADLRDLSLGDVGQFSIQHEPVDPTEILGSVASAFAAEATSRGVRLALDIDSDLPEILGDETRLRQCLRNLVENAVRHTPAGGRVTLRGRAADGTVTLEVGDTGEGIAPEHLPHLFERFFRADPSRARRSGGSGLGLAIVQQIVRAHGGEVTAASDGPGRGSTFTIRLPAIAAVEADELVGSAL